MTNSDRQRLPNVYLPNALTRETSNIASGVTSVRRLFYKNRLGTKKNWRGISPTSQHRQVYAIRIRQQRGEFNDSQTRR